MIIDRQSIFEVLREELILSIKPMKKNDIHWVESPRFKELYEVQVWIWEVVDRIIEELNRQPLGEYEIDEDMWFIKVGVGQNVIDVFTLEKYKNKKVKLILEVDNVN